VADLKEHLGGLTSPLEAEGIWTEIWYSEAHNSTAIEGNTLVLHQVERLLRDGQAVGDKQLSEYLEVRGYAEAADWVYRQALAPGALAPEELLTLAEVRQIHAHALGPVWEVAPHLSAGDREQPGAWREQDIRPFPRGMTPPHTEIQVRMTDWVADVNAIRSDEAPIAEAMSKRHAAFERIHPFLDGNGRMGRLLTNLVLVRLGYPPAIIHKRDRAKYLEGLDRADRGDPGPLGEMFARAITENLTKFIIPAVAGRRSWCRWCRWRRRSWGWLRCGRPRSGGGYGPCAAKMGGGGAAGSGWTSTERAGMRRCVGGGTEMGAYFLRAS